MAIEYKGLRDLDNLGTYSQKYSHISDLKGSFEPMRDNVFEFLLHFDSTLTDTDGTEIDANDAQEVIRLSANKVNIPDYEQAVLEIKRGNMTMKAAGTMSFGSGTFELIDYVGVGSKSILQAWRRLSGDPKTEAVGLMKDYKKNGTLIEYTPDFRPVRYWEIQGAWLSSCSDNGVSNEGGDSKRVFSANLIFDKAILHDGDDYE